MDIRHPVIGPASNSFAFLARVFDDVVRISRTGFSLSAFAYVLLTEETG